MRIDKAEVTGELDHQRAMVSALRKRLRVLDLQVAQQGITTQPQIVMEIASLNEQIERHRSEVEHLESALALDQFSMDELDYKQLVAQAWIPRRSWPRLVDTIQLEKKRIQIGLLPEKAKEIEREVRAELAREVFYDMPANLEQILLTTLTSERETVAAKPLVVETLERIGFAIRRDPKVALQLLLRRLPDVKQLNILLDNFRSNLFYASKVDIDDRDVEVFDAFVEDLGDKISALQIAVAQHRVATDSPGGRSRSGRF